MLLLMRDGTKVLWVGTVPDLLLCGKIPFCGFAEMVLDLENCFMLSQLIVTCASYS